MEQKSYSTAYFILNGAMLQSGIMPDYIITDIIAYQKEIVKKYHGKKSLK